MKNRNTIIIGVSAVMALGLVIYLTGKTKKDRMIERLERIADEGYETAGDILFPLKNPWIRRYRFDNYGRKGKFSI